MAQTKTVSALGAARTRVLPWVVLSYLAIGLAALLLRVLDLGSFLNGDEALFWVRRSELFLRALQTGDLAATSMTEHPGVTTMWLGAAGLSLRAWLFETGLLRHETFPLVLTLIRLPLALVHTMGVLVGYALLRRLLPAAPAALGALLWAADPFVLGYSRMLHVDALTGTFATVSLLAGCCYWLTAPRRRFLVLAGVCAGLTLLSKLSGVALLPALAWLALAGGWRRWSAWRALLLLAAVSLATVLLLWPALWVAPLKVQSDLLNSIDGEAGQPHAWGNYFLGREDDSPGPLFYPVALVLRLTPWTLLGLLLLPLAWRASGQVARRTLAALVLLALLYLLELSIFPKRLNRYLEPAFPALDLLAATSLTCLASLLGQALGRLGRPVARYATAALIGVVALAALLNAAYWHPYGVVAFNQALGGAQAGADAFLVGTGEGLELAADWLNAQPDITDVLTAGPITAAFQPYLRSGARVVNPTSAVLPSGTGYMVVYIRQVQRAQPLPPVDQFYRRAVPLHVVRLRGVEYAWIYAAPPSVAQPRPARFGQQLALVGFDQRGPLRRGQPLVLQLTWQALAAPSADYVLFAHLLGPDGRRYAQVDLPLPMRSWAAGRFQPTELPLAVPADAPAGSYQLLVGLYDPASAERLSLQSPYAADPARDGPHALLLGDWQLTAETASAAHP